MRLFRKFFASLFLGLLPALIIAPSMVLGQSESTVVLVGNLAIDTCYTTIQCEEVETDVYVCNTPDTGITGPGQSVHNIPSGNLHLDILPFAKFRAKGCDALQIPLKVTYQSPIIALYPFVRITKIQV